jgi:phosphatidylglycerophosphatase A
MTIMKTRVAGPEIAWWGHEISIVKRMAFFIATSGGFGLSKVAPGTAGSLASLFAYFYLGRFGWSLQLLVIIFTILLGLWSAYEVEKETGKKDDQRIVIDEVIGMWITLWAIPVEIKWLVLGFIFFRALDMLKPFPANWVDQRMKGAPSVIFDDVVSAVFAHALLRATMHLERLL